MKKEFIIPFTISFFIFVCILAWFAVDGNGISIVILNVIGGSLLFFVFVVFPALWLRKYLPSNLTFAKSLIISIVSFAIFWTIVVTVVEIKPQWGWNYIKYFDKYMFPVIKDLYNSLRY